MALPEVGAMKRAGTKIVMVTAYDHPSARLASEAGIDLILVGDSAGNNVLGYDTTVPVSMDEAVMLTGAVARAKPRALVIGDMPFGSFQASDEEAVANAVRLVKAGADAVKLEGAGPMVARVSAIVGAGIPVMGHLGLTPQSATMLGGMKAQGATAAKARQLLADARALEGGRVVRDRAGVGAGPHRRPRDRRARNPDHRDRRRAGLRWTGARLA